jgi:hypothetical protein
MTYTMNNEAPSRPGYPIVERRSLEEARRRGPLGIRSARRSPTELIRPAAGHHVLVYKVDNDYILDDASLGSRDDQVVRASHVSVVDMQLDAPVEVALRIPSKDSAEFTVLVTFNCTVTDPITIVKRGVIDPQTTLASYLKSYHNVMQMGLEFDLDDVNEARRSIDDELTAYRAVAPPHIDGLEVKMGSITVETPRTIGRREEQKREMRDRHTIETTQLDYSADYRSRQTDVQHKLDMEGLRSRQRLNFAERDFDEVMQLRERDHLDELEGRRQTEDLRRRAQLHDFHRTELRAAAELLKSDPDMALYLAYVEGQANPLALSEAFRSDRDTKAEREREREQREIEYQRRHEDREYDDWRGDQDRAYQERQLHEDRQYQWRIKAMEVAQRERLEELAAKRDDAQVERERNRRLTIVAEQRAMLELNWQREDTLAKTTAEREENRRRVEGQFKLLADLIARGHFDTADVDLVRVVSQFTGGMNPLETPDGAIGDGKSASSSTGNPTGDPHDEH